MRTLINVDERKKLAVYEEDGIKRVVQVKLDSSGQPILDTKTETELNRLFQTAKPIQIPDVPYTKEIPITIFQKISLAETQKRN